MVKGEDMARDIKNYLKWRENNILRYELTLNKSNDKIAYNHFKSIKNKREYLINLIEKDARKEQK